MGLVESTFGLMPGCGGTVRLPEIVGTGKALEMILNGQIINSEDALKLKIVSGVVHHRELLNMSINYIKKLSPYYRVKYECAKQS